MTTSRRPQTTVITVLVPESSVHEVTTQVDRPSAEPVISEVTVLQPLRKTAREKGGIEIEGCGIWDAVGESSRFIRINRQESIKSGVVF